MVLASILSSPVLLTLHFLSEGPERSGGGLPLAVVPVIIFIILLLIFLSSYFASTGIQGMPQAETAVPHDSHDSPHDDEPMVAAIRTGSALQTEVAETALTDAPETAVTVPEEKETAVAVPEEVETAVTVSEPAPSAVAIVEEDPAPVEPDNLKIVEGIGPKIEGILHAAGIKTFAQLAAAEVSQLEKIVREDAGIRVAFPDTWPEQAKLAAAGLWEALEKLQEELKGGRRK